MNSDAFQYSFDKSVDLAETEATLLLAMIATEALHGSSAVRLNGRYRLDRKKRLCNIDAGADVGRDLNRIFVCFMQREFGPAAFQVQHIPSTLQSCVN